MNTTNTTNTTNATKNGGAVTGRVDTISGTGDAASAIIARLAAVGIGGNILLTAFKLFAGFAGHSGAMISDAVHSLSDVAATLIAAVGVRMSRRAADIGHPYGHERMESIATLALSVVLALAAFAIGKGGVEAIMGLLRLSGSASLPNDAVTGGAVSVAPDAPGVIALVAAIVSIVTKEAMFWYTRHYARVLNSGAFMADAWHHRSDAMSSVGSLVGIAGARLGFAIADPLASIVICLFIFKVAITMAHQALSGLVDQSCSEQYTKCLTDNIASFPGVVRVDKVRTRLFGNRVYVDLEIAVDGDLPLRQAHAIAQAVHDGVEKSHPDIKHIMIHVNPA